MQSEAIKLIEKRLRDPDLLEHERQAYLLCIMLWEPYERWLKQQIGFKSGAVADSMTMAITHIAVDCLFTVGLLRDDKRLAVNPATFLKTFENTFNSLLNSVILQMKG